MSPIAYVDRIPVGKGERGPITKKIQEAFFGIVRGEVADRHKWLTAVPQRTGASTATAAVRHP